MEHLYLTAPCICISLQSMTERPPVDDDIAIKQEEPQHPQAPHHAQTPQTLYQYTPLRQGTYGQHMQFAAVSSFAAMHAVETPSAIGVWGEHGAKSLNPKQYSYVGVFVCCLLFYSVWSFVQIVAHTHNPGQLHMYPSSCSVSSTQPFPHKTNPSRAVIAPMSSPSTCFPGLHLPRRTLINRQCSQGCTGLHGRMQALQSSTWKRLVCSVYTGVFLIRHLISHHIFLHRYTFRGPHGQSRCTWACPTQASSSKPLHQPQNPASWPWWCTCAAGRSKNTTPTRLHPPLTYRKPPPALCLASCRVPLPMPCRPCENRAPGSF